VSPVANKVLIDPAAQFGHPVTPYVLTREIRAYCDLRLELACFHPLEDARRSGSSTRARRSQGYQVGWWWQPMRPQEISLGHVGSGRQAADAGSISRYVHDPGDRYQ